MAFYIGTKKQCEDYDEVVKLNESYSGSTSSWGVPRKHPLKELFSIRKHWKYECFEMEQIETISADWNSRLSK